MSLASDRLHYIFTMFESAIIDQLRDADDLPPVERALQKYILDCRYMSMVADIFDQALDSYPNSSPVTIYRGINFADKEQYEEFINSIKNNTITLKKCTSWSTQYRVAEEFAMTRKTHTEVMDFMASVLIKEQEDSHENITGYRGLVISTRIPAHHGIDIAKFSDQGEAEIILPAGQYKISYKEILTYQDMFPDREVNNIINHLNKDNLNKLFKWILHNEISPDQLTPESRKKVYNLTLNPNKLDYSIKVVNKSKLSPGSLKVMIYPLPELSINVLDWWSVDKAEQYKAKLKKLLLKLFKDLLKIKDTDHQIVWEFNINVVAKLANCEYEFKEFTNRVLSKDYIKLNSKSSLEKINSLSGSSREQAMKDYIAKLTSVLNQSK